MKLNKPHIFHASDGWRVGRCGDNPVLFSKALTWVHLANRNLLRRHNRYA